MGEIYSNGRRAQEYANIFCICCHQFLRDCHRLPIYCPLYPDHTAPRCSRSDEHAFSGFIKHRWWTIDWEDDGPVSSHHYFRKYGWSDLCRIEGGVRWRPFGSTSTSVKFYQSLFSLCPTQCSYRKCALFYNSSCFSFPRLAITRNLVFWGRISLLAP